MYHFPPFFFNSWTQDQDSEEGKATKGLLIAAAWLNKDWMGGCRYIILSKIFTHPSKSLTARVKLGSYTWRLLLRSTLTSVCKRMGRSQDICEFQHGTLTGCRLSKRSSPEISSLLNIPHETVSGTLTKWKRLGTTATRPQNGRPGKITERGQQVPRRRVHRGQALPVPTLLHKAWSIKMWTRELGTQHVDWPAQHSDLNRTPPGWIRADCAEPSLPISYEFLKKWSKLTLLVLVGNLPGRDDAGVVVRHIKWIENGISLKFVCVWKQMREYLWHW